MIIVLTGNNDYMRRLELKRMTEEYVSKYGDLGLERIDAGSMELGQLLEVVASLPFLVDRRMIVINNISLNKDLLSNAEQFINSASEHNDIVIDEPKFDKRLSLYKSLKKLTNVLEFNDLKDAELVSWLVKEASARGGKLSRVDATYLVGRIGANQMLLNNELDKLLNYSLEVNRQSVDLLTEPMPASSIFDLLDAAFGESPKKAMTLFDEQRSQQVEPQEIMGMIGWQLHILAIVKFNQKLTLDEIAAKSKVNPFVLRKASTLARSLSTDQVKNLVEKAVLLDARLKSEAIDADDAVQEFILNIKK